MIARRWFFAATLFPNLLLAQSGYDQHVVFDHSLTPARYFYSSGQTAELADDEIRSAVNRIGRYPRRRLRGLRVRIGLRYIDSRV